MTHNPKDDEGVADKAAAMAARAQEAWGGEGVTQRKQLIQNDISNSGPDMSKHIGGNQSLQEWESPSCPVCSGIGRDPKTLVTCSSCYGSGKDDTGLPIRKPDTPQSVPPESDHELIAPDPANPGHAIILKKDQTHDAPLSQGEELDADYEWAIEAVLKNYHFIGTWPQCEEVNRKREKITETLRTHASLLAERDKLATDIAELKALVPEAKEELRALRLQRDKLVERVSVLEHAASSVCQWDWSDNDPEPVADIDRLRAALTRQARHDPKDRQSEGGE